MRIGCLVAVLHREHPTPYLLNVFTIKTETLSCRKPIAPVKVNNHTIMLFLDYTAVVQHQRASFTRVKQ